MLEIALIALALSADAFAISIGIGANGRSLKHTWFVALYFGLFHAMMPAIGYFVGIGFVKWIDGYARWIGFVLLLALGLKMLFDTFKAFRDKSAFSKQQIDIEEGDSHTPKATTRSASSSLSHLSVLALALATSIDAMAAGFTIPLLEAQPLMSFLMIGFTTGFISLFGLSLGKKASRYLENKAGVLGGLILIGIGFRLLLS
uniref:manganese efflux pump MntP n=1 Tax=Ningiella ruwaisensis TaxID=2364274 RepID=UPI00144876A2|nr:manganese efflux pump [Ningiella ruwaisensis]